MLLFYLIMYDYSDIRITKPAVFALNKGFYTLLGLLEIIFLDVMFKNHTIFHKINN